MRIGENSVEALCAVAVFKGFENKLCLTVDAADRGDYPKLVSYADVAVRAAIDVNRARLSFGKVGFDLVVSVFEIFRKVRPRVVRVDVRACGDCVHRARNGVAVLDYLFALGNFRKREFVTLDDILGKHHSLVLLARTQIGKGDGNVVKSVNFNCLF